MLKTTEFKSNIIINVKENDYKNGDTISHVEMIHKAAKKCGAKGRLVVASYGENPETGNGIIPKVMHFPVGDVAGTMAFIKQIQANQHRNIYMPLASFSNDLPQGKKGGLKDIELVFGFCGDFDDDRACEYADRLPLPSDLVLETSKDRFQAFYLFDRGLTVEEAKTLAEALKSHAKCDHGTVDLCHVWRVPGCLNWPNKKKVDAGRSPEPQPVRIHEDWNETFTDPDALREALGMPAYIPGQQSATPSPTLTVVPTPTAPAHAVVIIDDRTDQLIDVVIDNIANGAAPEKFEKMLSVLNNEPVFMGRPMIGNSAVYPSESERDHSILCSLMYYTGDAMADGDRVLTVQAMLWDGLIHRPKWKERRGSSTWFQLEVLKAFKFISASTRGFYIPYKATDRKFMCTDTGNAERFAAQHEGKALYCHPWKRWLGYDGKRWATDSAGRMQRLAKQTVRSVYDEAKKGSDPDVRKAIASWAVKSEAKKNRKDMLELAQSEPCFPVQPEDLDVDPWLLNVQNGTLDLQTGKLMPHDPRHRITKMVPVRYDPKAAAPRWEKFIQEVVEPDMGGFLQRASGYNLTGDTSEKCIFIIHGESGNNGKTVYVNKMSEMLGDYAKTAQFETFLQNKKDGRSASEDIARLAGARLVTAGEAHNNQKLDENLIKRLTGRDIITARGLYQDSFEFRAGFKIWLAGNSLPQVKNDSHAVWDRIKIIEFNRKFVGSHQDKQLEAKLSRELPGILAWAVRGLMDYHRMGLAQPVAVTDAVNDHRAVSDFLQRFINERCEIKIGAECPRKKLYAVFCDWWKTQEVGVDNGGLPVEPIDSATFGKKITNYGVESGGQKRIDGERDRVWVNIRIINS